MMRRSDYKEYPFLLPSVLLRFDLGDERTIVESAVRIERKPGVPDTEPLVLFGRELKLLSLKIDGVEVSPEQFEITTEALTLWGVPEKFELFVQTEIHPEGNTTGDGLYLTQGAFCSQCEPEGFRKLTYWPDRPDVLSIFTVEIIADKEKYPVLLSNGNKLSQCGNLNKTVAKWHDPFPKPSYLFALVAGKLKFIEDTRETTISNKKVVIRIFSTPENIASGKCAHAMDSIKAAMLWDEMNFGREYDLDLFMIFVSPTFNMGAMENKGLNIFNEKYVLWSESTATDLDFERVEGVIGHEYFHNWSGDRVTCRDWFQLSLKEGFTVYRDQEFSRSRWGLRKVIDDVRLMRTAQFAEDAGPLAHPIRLEATDDPQNFYTSTVYEKGAEVIRMIEKLLGKDKFCMGTDLYFSRFDGQAVTCEDFVATMEEAGGMDLSQFRNWYSYAGTPEVEILSVYDSRKKILVLYVKQSCPPTPGQPTKPAFVIPLEVGFVGPDGDMKLKTPPVSAYRQETGLLVLTKPEETFVFTEVPFEPSLSLNRGFAPVRVKYDYREGELEDLVLRDPNAFARWDASQKLAHKALAKILADIRDERPLSLDEGFTQIFGGIVNAENIDKNLQAAMLVLPFTEEIANECEVVDPVAIWKAREFLKKRLGARYYSGFELLYAVNHSQIKPKFDSVSVAERTLANVALEYLSAASPEGLEHFALYQFEHANGMTDEFAGFSLVVGLHPDMEVREKAISAFYRKYRSYSTVLDKWFAAQARTGMLSDMKKLMSHPDFDINNPNRVKAVVGEFANRDLRFHDLSGEGYRFLADFVILYDRLNPTVAARMIESLTNWRRYSTERGALMKAQLERIRNYAHREDSLVEMGHLINVSVSAISKGVMEKIEKSLAE